MGVFEERLGGIEHHLMVSSELYTLHVSTLDHKALVSISATATHSKVTGPNSPYS